MTSDSLRHDLAANISDLHHATSGGRWQPRRCIARHRVAILVPYRQRTRDLVTLLRVLHQLLRRQMIDYTIFIIEQVRVFMWTIVLTCSSKPTPTTLPYLYFWCTRGDKTRSRATDSYPV